MSGGVSFGHGNSSHGTQAPMSDDPPHSSWGHDAYIAGLLSRAEHGDSFSSGGHGGDHGGGHDKGSILSSITKWAGLAFAGVLGFLGLKKLIGPRLFGAVKK